MRRNIESVILGYNLTITTIPYYKKAESVFSWRNLTKIKDYQVVTEM
jgi:hypothetical protein